MIPSASLRSRSGKLFAALFERVADCARIDIRRLKLALGIGRDRKAIRVNQFNIVIGSLFLCWDVEAEFDIMDVQKAAKIELGTDRLDLVAAAFHLRESRFGDGDADHLLFLLARR